MDANANAIAEPSKHRRDSEISVENGNGVFETLGQPDSQVSRSRKRSSDEDEELLNGVVKHEGGENGSSRTKKTRVRTGCLQCKRRRVRCDEKGHPTFEGNGVAGTCNACERLGLRCDWDIPGNEPLRRRRPKVKSEEEGICQACRARQLLCSKERPQCGSCLLHQTACTYGSDSHLVPAHLGSLTEPISRYQALVGRIGNSRLVRTLVDSYFVEVYPCTIFSFLHPDSFVRSVENQTAPASLVLAVCAMSAKYVLEDVSPAAGWMAEAKRQAMQAIQSGSLTTYTLSTLVLCFHYELFNREFVAAWMTSGSAIRLAFALRLNLDLTDTPVLKKLSFSELECRRRLMWSVYVIDMYVSDGFSEYTTIPWTAMRIALPSSKEDFEAGHEVEADHLSIPTPGSDGSWSPPQLSATSLASPNVQYILVFSIRTKILRYVRHLAGDNSLPWEEHSTFASHRKLLRWWRENLPPELEIENRTLPFPVHSAQITALFSVHLWHLISFCDLCRIALSAFVEAARPEVLLAAPLNFIQSTQDECVEHAGKLLRLCDLVLSHCPTFVSRDPYISVCFYQAIRITLWDLFRHPSPSKEMKRSIVSLTRGALVHLFAMSDVFPYSQCMLNDSFKLLQRYGLAEYLPGILPPRVFAAFQKAIDETKPVVSGAGQVNTSPEQDEELSPLSDDNSPEPISQTLDHSSTDLLRPPFHSRKDTRITLEVSDGTLSISGSDQMLLPNVPIQGLPDKWGSGSESTLAGHSSESTSQFSMFPDTSFQQLQPDSNFQLPFDLDMTFDNPDPMTRAFFDGSLWSMAGDMDPTNNALSADTAQLMESFMRGE